MRVLGIDVGTSTTVAAVRAAGGPARPLLFDATPLLPSAVFLQPGGALLVGGDAQRAARLDPARYEPHPKRRIDDGTVLLGPADVPVPHLIGAVLRAVADEARRQLGGVDEVRLTHPAGWGERRRAVLRAAARVAGLPHPLLVAEPVAAARYLTVALGAAVPPGRAVAVYDLGGGTFDAAVVRRTGGPTGFEVLAERGLPDLGGVDFDHALVEHLGRTYADTRTTRWRGLTAPADTGQRRARALLYDDVRAAKESLSRATSADVHLPALDIDAHVTRAELEDLIRPRLGDTVACLAEAIAAARLTPAELAGVLLVGGSSRIPLAAHLIHARLGLAPTTLEQPETAVALGALHGAFAGPPAGPAVVGGGPVTRGGPPPVVPYPQPPPEPAPRPWYAEPIALATVVLFVLVLIAAGVLIALVVG